MMYHVVKCDDCGFTMTVPWNVAADQHAKAHGWFIYPPQARCPKCGMPKHDEAAIVLTTGSIPEYAGYELICCIKSIPDAVQLDIEEA